MIFLFRILTLKVFLKNDSAKNLLQICSSFDAKDRSLNFLRFFFETKSILILSLRADSFGGAAGGGAAPEHSEAEGRANTLKFDISCKRSASKNWKAVGR